MSQHPEQVALAIKLRELGWKWSVKKRVWYRRVPGTNIAAATPSGHSALNISFMEIVNVKKAQPER